MIVLRLFNTRKKVHIVLRNLSWHAHSKISLTQPHNLK